MCICLSLVLAAGIYVVIPKYGNPVVQVNSYETFQRRMSFNRNVLMCPEDYLPGGDVEYSYSLYIKNRLFYTCTEGYFIGCHHRDNPEIRWSIRALEIGSANSGPSGDKNWNNWSYQEETINGIQVKVGTTTDNIGNGPTHSWTARFEYKGYRYNVLAEKRFCEKEELLAVVAAVTATA